MTRSSFSFDEFRERLVGHEVEDIATPALLLDLNVLERNIGTMATAMDRLPATLRPHCKAHKSPEIARRQIAAGAAGVAVATIWEAAAMVAEGIQDVLVANQITDPLKLPLVAHLAERAHLTVAVDDVDNVKALDHAVGAVGGSLGVVVECDTGMKRGGARNKSEAVTLANAVSSARHLQFRGVMGWEGHSLREHDTHKRQQIVAHAIDVLLDAVGALDTAGHHCEVVSAGGTATFEQTGAYVEMTEIQAGSYAVMDVFHEEFTNAFDPAISVLGSVVSRHADSVVLDVGRKAIGILHAPPRVMADGGTVRALHEEHMILDQPNPAFRSGSRVQVIPGYAAFTVNAYDALLVVDGDVVCDVWPVAARYGASTMAGLLYP